MAQIGKPTRIIESDPEPVETPTPIETPAPPVPVKEPTPA